MTDDDHRDLITESERELLPTPWLALLFAIVVVATCVVTACDPWGWGWVR